MLAIKSVWQSYEPTEEVTALSGVFNQMVNIVIGVGLNGDVHSIKRLSELTYSSLTEYKVLGRHKICVISRAAGILASREEPMRRGKPTKDPHMVKPMLTTCYHVKIQNGKLLIPIAKGRPIPVKLNKHVIGVISEAGIRVSSFTITPWRLSLCISKEVLTIDCRGAARVDRNLRNVTFDNDRRSIKYDLSETVDISKTSNEIVSSFKRNDARVLKAISGKYGRRKARVRAILHNASKMTVEEAANAKEVMVFEDIDNIRNLYANENGRGKDYRRLMNLWPYGELKRQVTYKAAWAGAPAIQLTKRETMGTSTDCPRCGERLQSAAREDRRHYRKMWCQKSRIWTDRDAVAVMNQSRRGWVRFAQSLPDDMRAKGAGGEAVIGNPVAAPVILRVDPTKPSPRDKPGTWRNL